MEFTLLVSDTVTYEFFRLMIGGIDSNTLKWFLITTSYNITFKDVVSPGVVEDSFVKVDAIVGKYEEWKLSLCHKWNNDKDDKWSDANPGCKFKYLLRGNKREHELIVAKTYLTA